MTTRPAVPDGSPNALAIRFLVFCSCASTLTSAASSVPTPLYRRYEESMGISTFMVSMVFAVYSGSLLVSLLTLGRLSDDLGRRPLILGALALNACAMLIFITATDFAHLLAARLVQGFAVGAAVPALGAAIMDCDPRRGPLFNSVMPFVGLGLGALGAAILATAAPYPLQLSYGIVLACLAVLMLLLPGIRETSPRRPGALRSLRPSIFVPVQSRPILLRLLPVMASSWALGAFYQSLMPGVVATATGMTSPIVGGSVVALLMATATLAAIWTRERSSGDLLNFGSASMAIGIAVSLWGVHAQQLWLLVAGALLGGPGFGCTYAGCLRALLPTATPAERAGLVATFNIISYCAFSLPAVAAGLAATRWGLAATTYVYGGVLILLSVMTLLVNARPSQRTPPASPLEESRMPATDDRLHEIERRITHLEDQSAIFQILATYGPGVDSMVAGAVRDLWTEDGVYDAGGFEPFVGEAIADHLYHDWHQRCLAAGCAHVMSMPLVSITGDTAVATSYSRVYVRHDEHWVVERVSANRWEFERLAGSWKVTHRLNRPLNGTEVPRNVLAAAFS